MSSITIRIRQVLRQHGGTLTVPQIKALLDPPIRASTIHASLHRMPDVYISHYESGVGRGGYSPAFKCVRVPPNAPHPIDQATGGTL